jgi:hypothetical protein
VIYSKALDRDQLVARLDDIKSRTKRSIELSRSLVDQSFLRFKATHRNLYAAQRSQELLKALPKTSDSAGGFVSDPIIPQELGSAALRLPPELPQQI